MSERETVRDFTEGRVRSRVTLLAILIAISAAAMRLIPLQFLHPLQWDELEYFRATRWIALGQVPFRDFWEHHTPLMWFVFAPFAALVDSAGVNAVIALRWAQVPVWLLTFWLTNLWMRTAGLGRFSRWAAMSLALSSAMLMIPAVEYRIDSLGCMMFMAALVLAQRKRFFSAGLVFCFCVFANLRFAPVVVVAALLLRIVRSDDRAWGGRSAASRIIAGGVIGFAGCLAYLAVTGSLGAFYEHVWVDNLAEKYATPVAWGFLHRLLVSFGVRLITGNRLFDLEAVDLGGVALLLLGAAGLVRALRTWREPGDAFVIGFLQVANLLFVMSMKFVYNYHLALVAIMFVPLAAFWIDHFTTSTSLQSRNQRVVVTILCLAWLTNAFGSLLRGKELDRAYQNRIMREVHERTGEGDRVWSGTPWALQREPAYRFWFLPDLARHLVREGLAPPYQLADIVEEPPAAVVLDHNALVWIATVQRELAPYFIRHYIPVWRNLWMPGMNGIIPPGQHREWRVPRDGEYAIHSSSEMTTHLWFRDPLFVARYHGPDNVRLMMTLPPPRSPVEIEWFVDGEPVGPVRERLPLRNGQLLAARNGGSEPLAVILYPGPDRILFRQPPAGVTLEGEMPRITHLPRFGVKIAP